jgi:hypothetical protein
MDKACLVTFLSESLIVPDAALQSYITWEAIDDTHAKGKISYYGLEASGVFFFNKAGELRSFSTEDRTYVSMDGIKQDVAWTALFSDYKTVEGRKQPSRLQAVWHFPEGDMIYFDSNEFRIDRM